MSTGVDFSQSIEVEKAFFFLLNSYASSVVYLSLPSDYQSGEKIEFSAKYIPGPPVDYLLENFVINGDEGYTFGNNRVTFSKSVITASTDVSAVPLPAALPLMLGGLGMLDFAAKRRRKA